MPQTQAWSTQNIKQCEKQTGQAMLGNEHALVSFSDDFGKLFHSRPSAVCLPQSVTALQTMIQYASDKHLPLTIRGNGMSQCGQSLARSGGVVVSMEGIKSPLALEEKSIWVEANTSWAALLDCSLKESLVPYVIPYNCDLSVAGVISAGGIGASSFKHGTITAQVDALEVITADGVLQQADTRSPLFHACLGGQGRFGVITKARIKLRPSRARVRTFMLVYLEQEQWLNDISRFRNTVDYMECFCSPSLQGAKLTANGRLPFAAWLFALHVSVEYQETAPKLTDLHPLAAPWKVLQVQDEPIHSYLHRHDSRFKGMKQTGLWDLQHLWYECFMPAALLGRSLDDLLASLPLHYATVVQVVPVAKPSQTGFFMLPETKDVFALMILNPGLQAALIPGCIETIRGLDERFLKQGGKRYLSGFLGFDLDEAWWKQHFNSHYEHWMSLKQHYDPVGIFQSLLHGQ